jgi:hypothetical protein
MKYIIIVFVVFMAFTRCTKTKTVTITKTDTIHVDSAIVVNNPTANSKVVTATSFPVNVVFSQNEIISAPDAVGACNLTLNFADSIPGNCCSVITYINAGASLSVIYGSNTDVALTAGSFANPAQGTNLIQFIFLGNINGINMVSASVVLQP